MHDALPPTQVQAARRSARCEARTALIGAALADLHQQTTKRIPLELRLQRKSHRCSHLASPILSARQHKIGLLPPYLVLIERSIEDTDAVGWEGGFIRQIHLLWGRACPHHRPLLSRTQAGGLVCCILILNSKRASSKVHITYRSNECQTICWHPHSRRPL